ncbi:sugar transferase (PEP-CTERM system associated)/exopolysaccharide biosynthesis polyprenyl glycosylphosphotransferase [Marinimicrobium koreense]|uniref:Sugar transferase (PEP-CTERM system associated)/exopolysaccharide biosynthesis polyprenyl glycosylphosphotransferase n=1 Tax=Marinimicrobium koreense TaxID=306545 RepID=A0A3N1NPL1_9GAMM|nr:TIGR03013 family XrtA/PEP-CTERM system glycosyltransferase [Marinimicrobium koreense]ROQ18083.1 sugar transferase (PEP-CTERM system associated)/exopolysaccharide biosynthesis polyprenyl glycosylphosphotransferase [Marinimicrobium koreense]
MSYIRLNKHYIHLPYLFLGAIEFGLLIVAAWGAEWWYTQLNTLVLLWADSWAPKVLFAVVLSCCTLSMGVYPALVREGYSSMVLRTLVSFFLLASLTLFVLAALGPEGFLPQGVIFWGVIFSTALVLLARAIFLKLVDTNELKRRVVIYGAGTRAQQLLDNLAPERDVIGVEVVGCIPGETEAPAVDPALVMPVPKDWVRFVKTHHISEIVVSPDERRQREGGGFPLNELIDCKLAGVPTSDALGFCERELCKIDIRLLKPGWMLFSDGFKYSKRRSAAKRLFDIGLAGLFVLLLWPFMLLTALAVMLESGRPVLYFQERVGLNGKTFRIYKFRSMRQDAEKGGKAVWAQKNDSRVTRVGAFIRNTRLDELPQLYNVLKGDMSFVGPRPERPEFVEDLSEQIPFYGMRHKVKPGLMGWAQLKYPYGASVEDARNKLQYDLYYTKNHSFLMDMLILIQTVEIVLLGKGVH